MMRVDGRLDARLDGKAWIIRGIIVAALTLLGIWIAKHTYWDTITLPATLKGEALSNDWYVAEHLTRELGITIDTLTTSESLPSTASTTSPNTILLHHFNWGVIPERRDRLTKWVMQGGHLVLDGSVYDLSEQLDAWLGIKQGYIKHKPDDKNASTDENDTSDDSDQNPESAVSQVLQTQPCDAMHSNGLASAVDDGREYHWCGFDNESYLDFKDESVWTASNEAGAQIIRVRKGKGLVTLLNGSPFDNETLLRDDNALLWAATLQLHRGDHLHLMSEAEHPSLLTLIWRHGWPVVLASLLLILALLWRQASRLGPLLATGASPRRSLAEQIRGVSAFLVRMGAGEVLHRAMTQALHREAQRLIPNYAQLDSQTRIEVLARKAGVDAAHLQQALLPTIKRSRHVLQRDLALLETTRRQLIASTRRAPPLTTE